MDYIPNKVLSHLLMTKIVLGCLLLGFGCAGPSIQETMRFENPKITIMGIPEGLRIRSSSNEAEQKEDDINKILHSDQFKSLFSYYVDESGKNFDVEGLGLEVVDYRGTLEPVQFDNFKVILLRTRTAKGNFEFRPVLTISPEATSGEYVEFTLTGRFLKITPKYTLTVDPLNPIVPRGFVQDLFYADKISAENVSISKLSGKAQARRGDIGGEVDLQNEAVAEFVRKYEHAIFGRFQVVERDDLVAVLPEQTVSIILSPKEKGYFRYGGREQPVEIVSVGTDQINVRFLDKEYALVPGKWVVFEDGWGVLYYKELDSKLSPNRAVLQYIRFSQDYIHTFGKNLRFKTPGPPSARALKPEIGEAPLPLRDKFVGRQKELKELDDAWESPEASVVGIIGWGGVGKTTLVRQWIYKRGFDQKNSEAQVVYWKTFHASKDLHQFIDDLEAYLKRSPSAPEYSSSIMPGHKLRTIADAIRGKRFVLVLDGLEVLQTTTAGDQLGKAVDPTLGNLLKQIVNGSWGRGLCIVTTRVKLSDVADYQGKEYLEIDLEKRPLSLKESVQILEQEGIVRGSDEQKEELASYLGLHPLALKMAAVLLSEIMNGDAGRWSQLPHPLEEIFGNKDALAMGRVLNWYDSKLSDSDKLLVTIISHFQEPPKLEWIRHVYRQIPADAGLGTGGLYQAFLHLKGLKLIRIQSEEKLEIHPLVAEHYRTLLGEHFSKKVHSRLYEGYRDKVFYSPIANPQILKDILPLFRSVFHAAKAGRYDEALVIYFDSIARQEHREHIHKYGAVSESLGTLSPFFQAKWDVPVPALNQNDSARLLNEVGTLLTLQGKLGEALRAYTESLKLIKLQLNEEGIVRTSLTLSQLYLLMGNIPAALEQSKQADTYSKGNKFFEMVSLSAIANAKIQKGLFNEAEELFKKAFEIKKGIKGPSQLEDAVRDYLYVTLLLEHGNVAEAGKHFAYMGRDDISDVPLVKRDLSDMPLVKRALYFQLRGDLTMALAVRDNMKVLHRAGKDFDEAIHLMRGAGIEAYLIGALLSRVKYLTRIGSYDAANRDLEEAMRISRRSQMQLHEVDCHIQLARLYKAKGELAAAKIEVGEAKNLADQLGYVRRKTVLNELMSKL